MNAVGIDVFTTASVAWRETMVTSYTRHSERNLPN